jgi:RNA polymerase sigma-70 factor (ECF subfamily)
LKAWLLSIARHKVEDYYRRRIREPEVLASLDADDVEPAAIHGHPDELIDKHRIADRIRTTLMTLSESYSLILLWRYWEMRSASEIAAATGKTEKAVERLLARARAQFKKKWNNE